MPDSSPAAEVVETPVVPATDTPAPVPAETTGTEGSKSSDSPPEKAVPSMLETVNAALQPKEVSPPSQTPDEADDSADPDPDSEDDKTKDDLSEQELSALSDRVKRRFSKLSRSLKSKDSELESLRPKAAEADKIYAGVARSGLEGAEVDRMVQLGTLIKTDANAALQALEPLMQSLYAARGDRLAPELQERVRLGYLTEEDARALSRSQAAAAHERQRADATAASTAEAEKARQTKDLVAKSISSVETWEKQKAAKDPDWSLKRDEVAEQVQLSIQAEALKRGEPYFPDAEEVVKLAEAGLKKVTERFKRFAPKPTAIQPATGHASPRSEAKPKNTLELINQVLGA